ncbi:MAG TPA: hypothetical protein VIE88_07095 [Vicinamibacteria bacterium]|jgi:hypothetical protein
MANAPVAPQQPQKKGLSPLAWVGIGCLGLLVIGGIVATVVTVFIAGKVKQVATEMEEDPVATTAKLLAAANPDVELVSTDKENRTVTFREVKTGKELTFGYDDIEKGRVTFSSGSETAELAVTPGDEGSGALTVKTSEGTATFRAGDDAVDLPSWVPVYPGVTPKGNFSAEGADQRTGTFSFTSDDDLESILDFYEGEAKNAGLESKSRTTTNEGGILIIGSSDDSRGLTVMASKKGSGAEFVVSFNEKR